MAAPPPTAAVERIAPYLRVLLAPNPGPMTLEGTNTWVVGALDPGPVLVVDPGPLDESHLQAVLDACGPRVATVLLTHRHPDHAEAAAEFARRAGCPVRAADPALRTGAEGLANGDTITVAGASLTVHATPGHTSDSCCFLVRGHDEAVRLLTGDTVLGRGTTAVAAPDGDLRDYLTSLSVLQKLVVDAAVLELLPGHGPRVAAPVDWLAYYLRHRRERLDQIRTALAAGDRTVAEVVARVYADVDPSVRPAAARAVRAQLAYLDALPEPG